MKTLKESILADIDDTIVSMDNAVKEYNKFGNNFKIAYFDADGSSAYSKLNLRSLKAIALANKGNFKPINKPTNYSHWAMNSKDDEKMNLFATWLDNLDVSDFKGYDYMTKEFTDKFEQYLNEQCKKYKVFNNDQTCVKIMSKYSKDPSTWHYNIFTICITSSKSSNDKTLKLHCKPR